MGQGKYDSQGFKIFGFPHAVPFFAERSISLSMKTQLLRLHAQSLQYTTRSGECVKSPQLQLFESSEPSYAASTIFGRRTKKKKEKLFQYNEHIEGERETKYNEHI